MVRTLNESTMSAMEDNSCLTEGSRPSVETEIINKPRTIWAWACSMRTMEMTRAGSSR